MSRENGSVNLEAKIIAEKKEGVSRVKILPRQMAGLIMGPFLFFAGQLILPVNDSFTEPMKGVIISTLWIATWWLTEAVPLPVTSLLPLVLFPLNGVYTFSETAVGYANPIVFLFMGGFMLAAALQRWNLHRRIALTIIKLVGTQPSRLVFGFMVATGFLSMWISNTATAMMLVPVGLAVVFQVSQLLTEQEMEIDTSAGKFGFGTALMLGIAYSASIGGMGTLIGTPPNAIFVSIADASLGIDISFFDWLVFGLPISILFTCLAWFYLVKVFKLGRISNISGANKVIDAEMRKLGKMIRGEVMVLIIFMLVALGWVFRSLFLVDLIPSLTDPMIAVIGALLLFILPVDIRKGVFILDWDSAVKIPWGILILFGGGIAIANGFSESGLTEWLGNHLGFLAGAPQLLIIAGILIFIMFLSNITSNTGTVSMMLPVMVAMAGAMSVNSLVFMITATVAASFAFVLPVATPPNAVVFSSGYVSIDQMARSGLGLTIITAVILPVLLYFWLPYAWGFSF